MRTGHFPFVQAKDSDPLYKLVCKQKWRKFWAAHEKWYPGLNLSADFCDIIQRMLSVSPESRPSFDEIKKSDYFPKSIFPLRDVPKELKKQALRPEEPVDPLWG